MASGVVLVIVSEAKDVPDLENPSSLAFLRMTEMSLCLTVRSAKL